MTSKKPYRFNMSRNFGESENTKYRAKAMAAKDKKGKGRGGASEVVTCPGWTDEYGNWNTGFPCPKWGGIDDEYCCGSTHNRYCCPEPEPIAPTKTASSGGDIVPLIAGVAAGVVVVLILLIVVCCCCCPCCMGYAWMKRTRKPKDQKKDGEAALAVCQHCHATMTMTSSGIPETLACGCEIGGPPGSHHFTGEEPDLVLHLYENPYVENNHKTSSTPQHTQKPWTQIPDSEPEMVGSMHCEEPPPYDKTLMSGHRQEDPEIGRLSPCSEDTPMILRLQSPSKLCMKTFRPLGGTTSLSPLSGVLRTPRDAAIDQSRRDSGVLFDNEDQEQNSNKNYNGNEFDEREEEQDTYHESIVVPKFNFQSLSLVNKSGLNQSGLSHSRTSGLSGSRGRTRRSRSSVDSLELEHLDQLIESMNIQTEGLPQTS